MPEVQLSSPDLRAMVRLMRALYRLHRLSSYQKHIEAELPEVARFDPGNESVMMGYDFHLTPQGPKLIEVNTNAGGGLLAYRAYEHDTPTVPFNPDNPHQVVLLHSFAEEMALYSGGRAQRPCRVAILDQEPEKQFLHEEMQILRALLVTWKVAAVVVDPEALHMSAEGVFIKDRQGQPRERIDLVYNRHCDFYLETPALQGMRAAYLAGSVCLTPNPRIYGLLADKRRMILWSDKQKLQAMGLSNRDVNHISNSVPICRILADMEPAQLWKERKQWVFKPVTAYGSRGVLLGGSISRKRLATLDPETTLLQRLVPPSRTRHPEMQVDMKTDLRLFVYRNTILGVTARLYRGQITNFREAGSGYVAVRIQSKSPPAKKSDAFPVKIP